MIVCQIFVTDVSSHRDVSLSRPVPLQCCVTGGSGFVGQRLVEMLVERGAERVVSFDILPQPPTAWQEMKLDERN